VDADPLVAFAPDQAPEAVQAVAFVAVQFRVALAPLAILLGVALKVMVGAGALTVTVADWELLPPAPLQVSVNVELAVRVPVDCEP
jgi:hypothetical protein